MSTHNGLPLGPLTYGCTAWRESSQRAANAYENGRKLWTKTDLRDIEEQLGDSINRQVFVVRSIDGLDIPIMNPCYGETKSIWKPYVKFKEYWRLVKEQPDGPTETYLCSYLVDWKNRTSRDFRAVIDDPRAIFAEVQLRWRQSSSCALLRRQLGALLGTKKVTKLICFGLGDMCRQPPEWYMRQTASTPGSVTENVRASTLQHSIAMTMAEFCRNKDGAGDVQLLAQDPDYTPTTEEILRDSGFSIVGRFGAGGFAEIDDETLVFSAFVEAPLKQIIADIARPALIISTGPDTFNNSEKAWADAESPRTREMWQSYCRQEYPVSPEDGDMMGKMRNLYIYNRT
ncbi:hypothetical protein ACRE_007560 [Hapsidospora chrysogenum ATCC 11550]|uniref:SRR1-like domain-containing protein n=1 Tax=Hapsidospora chrysogenum (strain ATCC 11550 / CBS 779.69 / DSM 880 / IAM 14645 / JCM 23072 / IMI 49137) TaxID=857340 RepID=A0A086TG05_HAPC1|nr:hypothetical protein ACRE_007560 [Hapsidospora chrysogenum ATCC 11550]